MRIRTILLVCSCLLLMVSLASAAAPEQTVAPIALGEEGLALSPVEDSAGCSEAELAVLTPEARNKAISPCGPCSAVGCRGAQIGTYCGFNKTCQLPYYQLCTDGTERCYCWSGPLP